MIGAIITRHNATNIVGTQRELYKELPKLDKSRMKDGLNHIDV